MLGVALILAGATGAVIIGFFSAAGHGRFPSWPLWSLGGGFACWLMVAVWRSSQR